MNKSIHIDSPVRGIVLMMAGILMLTINDATGKWLTDDYPVSQVISLRSVFILIPLSVFIFVRGGLLAFRPTRITNHLLRSFFFIGSTFCIVAALSLMPLADAIAFTFISPIIIAALAPFVLGEKIDRRRWAAIIIGFIGVLVMLKPTQDSFQWAAFIALAAVCFSALRDMITRRISAEEHSDLILFYSTIAVMIVGLVAAIFFPWRMPNYSDFGLFALVGVLNGGAHYLLIEAHRWAEASVIAPFRYSGLVWAIILGFFIWDDIPDVWVLLGSVLVVSSGLYILQRENRLRKITN